MTTFLTRIRGVDADRPRTAGARPVSGWGFTGVAVTSFGGPLALAALSLSQLIVFAVYPRYAVRQGDRPLPAWVLGVASSAFAVYGLWSTFQHVPG